MAESKFPEGFTDEAHFLSDAREEYRDDIEADKTNRDAALDDLKFACDYRPSPGATHGAQWDDVVVRSRAGRPCLTNNVLPQYIGQIIGDNRINRPAIKVRPAEDADEDLAEIRAGLIRSIEYQSGAQGIYTQALQAQATCGVGFFRCGLDYAEGDTFLRELRIKPIADPLSVVLDRMSVERTGRDAKRGFIVDEYPRKEFEKRWPNAVPVDVDPLYRELFNDGWLTDKTVRLAEYYRVDDDVRELALMEDGTTIDITDEDAATRKAAKRRIKETRKVTRPKVCMWLISGAAVLEGPHYIPIDRIPVFRCFGQVYQVGTGRAWFGLVRFMKDQQRLQNYADSVIAETLALAPKAQWLADDIAVEGREATIREAHKSGDPLLVKNQGGEMTRLDPPTFPVALLQWRQTLTQSMKDVSGLHDASLGIQGNETSGKAIMARQREGDVATIVYHDNLNAAIGECGRVLNQLIPVVYDTARTIRIVGTDETAKVMKINDPDDADAVDLTKGKYDIVVETGPSYSTKRVEAAESMIAFVQAVPEAGAVTGDLIAKAQDWPDADKFADRLVALLPPELREQKDPSDMTPEERQAAEQQQQQMQAEAAQAKQLQEAAAMTELEKGKAEVRKLNADAERQEAEAKRIATEQPEQPQGEHPAIAQAEARKAIAEADSAESNAEAAQWKARAERARAMQAEQQANNAHTDAAFNALDAEHKVIHGRGITDPEQPAEGAETVA